MTSRSSCSRVASGSQSRGSSRASSRRASRSACRSTSIRRRSGRLVSPRSAGGAPLYRPEHPGSARWQRGEVVEGFYLADSEEKAWAEWYRALAELALPPMRQMPRDLWRFEVDLARAADLSSAERLERVGLPASMPDRRQWPTFQAVGETLFAQGWPGVVYASAARSESLALCLFRASDELPGVRPVPPPIHHDEPPAPPRGLRA